MPEIDAKSYLGLTVCLLLGAVCWARATQSGSLRGGPAKAAAAAEVPRQLKWNGSMKPLRRPPAAGVSAQTAQLEPGQPSGQRLPEDGLDRRVQTTARDQAAKSSHSEPSSLWPPDHLDSWLHPTWEKNQDFPVSYANHWDEVVPPQQLRYGDLSGSPAATNPAGYRVLAGGNDSQQVLVAPIAYADESGLPRPRGPLEFGQLPDPGWSPIPAEVVVPLRLPETTMLSGENLLVNHQESSRRLPRELEQLRQRLDELEEARIAHEEATRTVIDQAFSRRGSFINDVVVFGGTLEVLTGWFEDFEGVSESLTVLNTAEFDFEVQVNSWTLGSVILEYNDGADFIIASTQEDEVNVDRINVDTAFIVVGDTQEFWMLGKFGRMIVPFGISTGDPVADVLNIESPLTVDVFETKQDALYFGFEGPTPPRPPAELPPGLPQPPPVYPPPPVKPVLIAPFMSKFSRHLGYKPLPPAPPPEPTPITPPPTLPPVYGGVYFYNGNTENGGEDHVEHIGGSLGYRVKGVSPIELPVLFPCPSTPWSFEAGIDYNSSVFDSLFLEFEYRRFLDQIGYVSGMATHVRSMLGPVSIIAEWNGAIGDATLIDDLGTSFRIRPQAWQVSLGYQFGWNPGVQSVGLQGTYLTMSYSESSDLPGVTRVIGSDQIRVGFAPRKRFLISVGEWVFDTLRFQVEYSHAVDYSVAAGGTGRTADGFVGMLTYEW